MSSSKRIRPISPRRPIGESETSPRTSCSCAIRWRAHWESRRKRWRRRPMPRLALSSGSRGAELKERAPRDAGGARGAATSGVPAALRAIGVRPSRRLGQNFLIDPRVAERIAALVEDPKEPVIEIGPGLGALTMLLAATGRALTAVELDLRL